MLFLNTDLNHQGGTAVVYRIWTIELKRGHVWSRQINFVATDKQILVSMIEIRSKKCSLGTNGSLTWQVLCQVNGLSLSLSLSLSACVYAFTQSAFVWVRWSHKGPSPLFFEESPRTQSTMHYLERKGQGAEERGVGWGGVRVTVAPSLVTAAASSHPIPTISRPMWFLSLYKTPANFFFTNFHHLSGPPR